MGLIVGEVLGASVESASREELKNAPIEEVEGFIQFRQ